MGFLAYSLPSVGLNDNSIGKDYFILDKIDIQYVTVNGKEDINIEVYLYTYNSYEERLVRGDLLMTTSYSIQGLIDKNFSENLWNKCYIKIKELLLNKNTNNLREALSLSDSDSIPSQYQYLLEIDDHFN